MQNRKRVPQRLRRLSDREYDHVFARTPRLCVDLVIREKGRILLGRRTTEPYKGKWELPGGRVHFGESLVHALQRLAREETGLRIRVGHIVGIMEHLREYQNGKPRHSVSVAFLAERAGGRMRDTEHLVQVQFFGTLPRDTYRIHEKFLTEQRLVASQKRSKNAAR